MINKRAMEVPDDIVKWEDTVLDYIDKNYPYLGDGISNIAFSKKEESTKDGVGAVQYKRGDIEITIPIIIDSGELKEPNLGIYKDQIVPISQDMFNWLINNTQNFGELIKRDSQHISNMDYLQQTGLFEEPDMGGYKAAFLKKTAERIREQASLYPETEWLVKKIDKIATYQPDHFLVGMADVLHSNFGGSVIEYASSEIGDMPKIATDIFTPHKTAQLEAMPKAKSRYQRLPFTHKYASRYPGLKQAQEDGKAENELVRVSEQNSFGSYSNVLAMENGVVNVYSGDNRFDVKHLIEKKQEPVAMITISGGPKNADPEPPVIGNINGNCVPDYNSNMDAAIIGDVYGIMGGYPQKKDEAPDYSGDFFNQSYSMGDYIMFRLGKNLYSTPYMVDSKISGLIGPKMEHVTVLTILSPFDYSKADVIVSDVAEVKPIRKDSIKDTQLQSMLRTDNPQVWMVPSGSIIKGPKQLLHPADKGKMVSDIINGMPVTNMSMVVKISGDRNKSYEITLRDNGKDTQYFTTNEKLANAIVSYFSGENTEAEKLAAEGKIPLMLNPAQERLEKAAAIIAENVDAYIGAAAKVSRSVSKHFSKVAAIGNMVDGLIGVSFVDSARETDTEKISEQVMSLINSLGGLILMARMDKTSIPENEINRAFWSLAELLKVLRG